MEIDDRDVTFFTIFFLFFSSLSSRVNFRGNIVAIYRTVIDSISSRRGSNRTAELNVITKRVVSSFTMNKRDVSRSFQNASRCLD